MYYKIIHQKTGIIMCYTDDKESAEFVTGLLNEKAIDDNYIFIEIAKSEYDLINQQG